MRLRWQAPLQNGAHPDQRIRRDKISDDLYHHNWETHWRLPHWPLYKFLHLTQTPPSFPSNLSPSSSLSSPPPREISVVPSMTSTINSFSTKPATSPTLGHTHPPTSYPFLRHQGVLITSSPIYSILTSPNIIFTTSWLNFLTILYLPWPIHLFPLSSPNIGSSTFLPPQTNPQQSEEI